MDMLARIQSTERRIVAEGATSTDHGDYLVSRSIEHPEWYQANHIELRVAGGRSLADWERIFAEHFPPADYQHTAYFIAAVAGFEPLIAEIVAAAADEAADVAVRWNVEHITWMFARSTEKSPPIPDGLKVRSLGPVANIPPLLDFSLAETREEPWFVNDERSLNFLTTRGSICDRVGVEWFGLCPNDSPKNNPEILSRLGIFDCEGVSRLQAVGTAKAHRCKGYASALVGEAIRIALEERKSLGLALGVDTGTQAQRVYKSVGFEPAGQDCWAMRYPTS